jgi:ribosome-associated protein
MRFSSPDLLPEFVFKTSRSGGAGGQHVNKVSTKVQLQFDVQQSHLLSEDEKNLLLVKLENQLAENGVLQVTSQEGRSQHDNKLVALRKMYRLLNKCFEVPKPRKPSKPTKSSLLKKKTLKQRNSAVKKLRSKRNMEDGQ